jgi:hypothetical protein
VSSRLVSSRLVFCLLGLVPLAFAVSGCPDDDPPPPTTTLDSGSLPSVCPTGYLGDPNEEPVIELRALRADGSDVPLGEGGDLAVLFPPQGGRVAFVGVRAKNLDGCGMQIIGALRDPLTRQVRLDGRTVNLRRDPDGWGTTGRGTSTNIEDSAEIGDYSNVPLCPNQWAAQDVYDKEFELEVVVTDRLKRTARRTIKVIPRCSEPGEREVSCRCLCRNGYVLGEACGEDAGIDAAVVP